MKCNKLISVLCLLGTLVSISAGHCSAMAGNVETCYMAVEGEELLLKVKKCTNSGTKVPMLKSPILIPEVTLDGHTLHFITPCTGLTFQLVQDDEVCYETVITSDYLEIPAGITGMYELQILRGDYIFFAEVEL